MKESHSEGLASHTGPESCGVVREGGHEALTGVRAGRVLNRETPTRRKAATLGCRRRSGLAEGDTVSDGIRETLADPTRSETPRMYGHTSHGNRESQSSPAPSGRAGRIGKSTDARR
jgi:RNA-directed DNA polymerase